MVKMDLVSCICRSHELKIEFPDENIKNLLVWNHKAKSHDIWYVASSSGPVPSLFKLCPWDHELPHPRSHMFNIGLYSENVNKILSETTRPRALIFGM